MAKILYVTNCSRALLSTDLIWAQSLEKKRVNKMAYLPIRRIAGRRNFSHYLCDMGHEVDLLVPDEGRSLVHRNAKVVTNSASALFQKSIDDGHLKFLAPPTILCMPTLAKEMNLARYDMVICDSASEYIALKKKEWYHVFDRLNLKNSIYGSFLDDSLGLANILNWIDSPFQHPESEDMGELKTLFSADMLRENLRPKLAKIDNLFYAQGFRDGVASPMDDFYSADTAEKCEQCLDAIFTPIDENKEFRYHGDEFISKEIFDELPQIKKVRKENKIDKRTLFDGFPTAIMMHSPPDEKDTIRQLCDQFICFDSLTTENFADLFFGISRFTNKGYRELSEAANALL